MTQPVWSCQRRACPFLATSQVRRGEEMKFLKLCVHHGNQFRAMTNAECVEAARRCESAESYPGTHDRLLWVDLDDHDKPMPTGRRVA